MQRVIIHRWAQEKQEDGRMKSIRVETGTTGLFHGWGTDYEEYEGGPGNYTVAIVEMADGSVELVPAPLVKFDNPEK